mmetsp:Transcript_37784/g.106765  ORF Transcript_37784/g.106765 Transcript_37784/m.106765 type:complete len:392 (+) Transcript_37784:991-2166(+)
MQPLLFMGRRAGLRPRGDSGHPRGGAHRHKVGEDGGDALAEVLHLLGHIPQLLPHLLLEIHLLLPYLLQSDARGGGRGVTKGARRRGGELSRLVLHPFRCLACRVCSRGLLVGLHVLFTCELHVVGAIKELGPGAHLPEDGGLLLRGGVLQEPVVVRVLDGKVQHLEERRAAQAGLLAQGVVDNGEEDQPEVPAGGVILAQQLAYQDLDLVGALKGPHPVQEAAHGGLLGIRVLPALGRHHHQPVLHAGQLAAVVGLEDRLHEDQRHVHVPGVLVLQQEVPEALRGNWNKQKTAGEKKNQNKCQDGGEAGLQGMPVGGRVARDFQPDGLDVGQVDAFGAILLSLRHLEGPQSVKSAVSRRLAAVGRGKGSRTTTSTEAASRLHRASGRACA